MKNFLSKIHSSLFYIFIFSLPWQTIWIVQEIFYDSEKWHYGTIGIYASDTILILWLTMSTYIHHKDILSFISSHKNIFISASVLCLWTLLSITWASSGLVALYFWIKLTIFIYTFFVIRVAKLEMKKIAITFIASMLIQSILGLHQFATQETFSSTLLGLQDHVVWHGSTATVTTGIDGRWLRVYGGFPHPNIFGGMLISALLLNLWLFISTKTQTIFFTTFSFLCTTLFTANIFLTFSRSTWVAAFISMSIFTGFIFLKESSQQKNDCIKNIFIISLTFIFLTMTFSHVLSARKESTNFTHNSFGDRKTYMFHAKNIISDHFIFGAGAANYTNTVANIHKNKKPIWYYQPVHNSFVLVLAEIGAIGAITFFSFIFFILREFQQKTEKVSLEKLTLLLIIFSFFITSFFDHWLWTSHIGLLAFFVFLGLLAKDKSGTSTL